MARSTHRPILLLFAALALGACNSGGEAAKAPEPAGKADPLAPDVSADYCKLIPPEQVAEYKQAHGQFHSVEGLTPEFAKGQLFKDGDTLKFKWAEAGARPLGVDVFLLRNCSQSPLGGFFMQETTEGSGEVTATVMTNASGSSYPSGTPVLLRVTTTKVDMQTMKGTTTVVGEYTVTFQEPAE